MVEHESPEFASCAACGRTILRGERLWDYMTTSGEERRVCSLCRPRAEASGWVPAHLAGTAAEQARGGASPIRERLRAARERAAGLSAQARRRVAPPADETEPARARKPREAPERRAPAARPKPAKPRRRPIGERAVEAFNASAERRKVAGLTRSLGEPGVAVEGRAGDGETATITVAWELSWYRWEVDVGGSAPTVVEIAKGAEIAELGSEPPAWNARLAEDGSVVLGA